MVDILVDLQVVAIAVLFYGRSYCVDGQDEGRGEVAAIGVEDGKRFVGGGWSWVGVVLGLGGEVDVDGSGAWGVALAQLEDARGGLAGQLGVQTLTLAH